MSSKQKRRNALTPNIKQEVIDISNDDSAEEHTIQESMSFEANPNTYITNLDSIRTVYKCCNLEFDDKFEHFDHMLGHMKVVKCYFCEQWFSTDDDMIKHVISWHANQSCRLCKHVFNNRTELFNHLRLAHNYVPQKAPARKYQRPRQMNYRQSDYVANYKFCKTKAEKKFWKTKSKPTIKTEPTWANVKVEPTYLMNVKSEPTYVNVSNIKVEPT